MGFFVLVPATILTSSALLARIHNTIYAPFFAVIKRNVPILGIAIDGYMHFVCEETGCTFHPETEDQPPSDAEGTTVPSSVIP